MINLGKFCTNKRFLQSKCLKVKKESRHFATSFKIQLCMGHFKFVLIVLTALNILLILQVPLPSRLNLSRFVVHLFV